MQTVSSRVYRIYARLVSNPSEATAQGFGSMPIQSFTADEIRWVKPR